MCTEAVTNYLNKHAFEHLTPRAVLFDMDGVLFNSMPYHAEAWHTVMERRGLHLSREEAYMHEGRTGAGTINIIYQRQFGCDATQELITEIYAEKATLFARFPQPEPMPGAYDLLCKVKASGLLPVLVTGSGQRSLLDRLDLAFPGIFSPYCMVTAFDVKIGKPHPEPYLMGLRKAGAALGCPSALPATEALVVENAPLGVEAGVAAGIFTIAANTGPIADEVLYQAGANLLYPSIQSLCDGWEALYRSLQG